MKPLRPHRILDSPLVYAARTVGVLAVIFFQWARAALTDRLHVSFAR
jgi:hypothetical protein